MKMALWQTNELNGTMLKGHMFCFEEPIHLVGLLKLF